jgi:hypothetical protein
MEMGLLRTSRVWRHFLRSASILGLVSAVIALVLTAPARAVTDKTLILTYSCTGGPFSNSSLSVQLSVPDPASGTFDVSWTIPALTLRTAPTTTSQVKVAGKLAVTGGTHTDLDKTGASITSGSTSVLSGLVKSTVAVTATTGSQVTVKGSTEQGSLKLSVASAPSDVTSCTTTTTQSVAVTVGTGTGTGATDGEVVTYSCAAGTEGSPQVVKIKVTLTMPTTNPKAGEQFSIGWTGAYETGSELEAPSTGLPTGSKMYVYASISGLTGLTTVTGTADLTVGADSEFVTLPTRIDMRATSSGSGTGTVKPGAIKIGTSATSTAIECTVQSAAALKTYPLTIGAGTNSSPSPSPSASPTPSDTPTSKPSRSKSTKTSTTPKAGADTGGGGEAGPDGRMFLLAGSVLIGAAGVGGLMMRRRSTARP